MKVLSIILLITLALTNAYTYTDAHYLVLDGTSSTIDGIKLTSTAQYGVSITTGTTITVKISTSNTYVVSGKLTGQLLIATGSSDKVLLVLNGVTITYTSGPALLFTGGYEIYSGTSKISYDTARKLDFTNAGAKIIIADDSTNTITGNKNSNYDGALYSAVSMSISGETKGNGILNVVGSYEGMGSNKHLLIEGGVINVAAQDDGINTHTDNVSVCLIRGGTVHVNAGLGSEGDGIDSNGYIIIETGTVVAASKPNSDSGLDSNLGLIINGGDVVGVGCPMDEASSTSSQGTMNLQFSSNVAATSTLKITDTSGNEIVSFCASSAGLYPGTSVRTYSGATISSAKLIKGQTYYLYLDGSRLSNGGSREGGSGGGPRFGKNLLGATATSTSFTLTYSATTFLTVKKS